MWPDFWGASDGPKIRRRLQLQRHLSCLARGRGERDVAFSTISENARGTLAFVLQIQAASGLGSLCRTHC